MADTTRKPKPDASNEPMPFDEHTRRVLELRCQIREGSYQPDPRAIAEALLREWSWHDSVSEQDPAPGTDVRRMAGRFIVPPSETPGQELQPEARTA
jgi:hypothetical protein